MSPHRLLAQAGMELRLLLRNGENLLATVGIPVTLLVFFSLVPVLPTAGQRPVDFLVPGILVLAVMAAATVALGIATGFERAYLVLKRLGATPLRRGELIAAKALAVLAVETLQVGVVAGVGALLGWRPPAGGGLLLAAAGLVLGTAAFAGLGLAMAGALPASATLGAANGLFVVLLLVSGLVFPLEALPRPLALGARVLPAAPLADVLRAGFAGSELPAATLAILAAWAAGAPALAAAVFRWE
ncbi:MAG TPA: ABC transporter permease [Egibacteraceae bacterium]|nr:ABC transporter permease [Egibacteraceae bacterium]